MDPSEGLDPQMVSLVEEIPELEDLRAGADGWSVVRTPEELDRLCEAILGERERPIVAITLRAGVQEPVLLAGPVRAVLGSQPLIYLIPCDELLLGLAEVLGRRLALDRGSVRVWWPGVEQRSDPADHPRVLALDGEDPQDTLEELAEQFELTRPRVRRQIKLIEDARAFRDRELTRLSAQSHKVQERLRDAQIECHRLRTRAEAAEASLAAVRPPAELD